MSKSSITTQTQENAEKRVVGKPFKKGNPGGPGRKKLTKEQKLINKEVSKTVKDYLAEYEQGLAEALPVIRPALIKQAKKGNVKAIREIHEVVGAHKKGSGPGVAVQINFNDDREKYG